MELFLSWYFEPKHNFHRILTSRTLNSEKNVGVNDLEGLITHPQTRLLDQDSDCFPVLSQPGLILEVL